MSSIRAITSALLFWKKKPLPPPIPVPDEPYFPLFDPEKHVVKDLAHTLRTGTYTRAAFYDPQIRGYVDSDGRVLITDDNLIKENERDG